MTLRNRILLLLTLVVAGFVVADSIVQRMLVLQRFEGYENEFAEWRLSEVQEALTKQRDKLASLGVEEGLGLRAELEQDRADSSDVRDENGVASRNPRRLLAEGRLDLFFLVELRGRVLGSALVDPLTGAPAQLQQFPIQSLSPGHALLDTNARGGFLETELGTLLVGVADIPPADPRDPVLRAIAGRFMTDAYLADLGAANGVQARLSTLTGNDLTGDELEHALRAKGPTVSQLSPTTLSVEELLVDIRGLPAILMRLEVPRDLVQLARDSASDSTKSGASAAILLLLTLVCLLQRIVIDPLRRLTDHAVLIGATNDTTQRLDSTRKDELGVLAREFDRMVAELERSRNQTTEMARLAGMLEIAAGILHNIGNVLNSVNVSAKLSAKRVDAFPVEDLRQAIHLIEAHSGDLDQYVTEDARGKHLFAFLHELHDTLAGSRQSVHDELDELLLSIEHISSLVQAQVAYAGRTSAATWVTPEALIEQAVKIATQARPSGLGLDIQYEFAPTDSIEVERHKVLEVLVNLLVNAFESLEASAPSAPRVQLRLGPSEAGVFIEVDDNGAGIDPARFEEIFHAGTSSKPDGQGLGLHGASLTATELGGRLDVHSAGRGAGATFRLTLPRTRNALAA